MLYGSAFYLMLGMGLTEIGDNQARKRGRKELTAGQYILLTLCWPLMVYKAFEYYRKKKGKGGV